MSLADSVQIVGIGFSILLGIISMSLVYRQIRLQNQQMRASTCALLASQLDSLNKTLLEYVHVDIAETQAYAALSDHERIQCNILYHLRFNLLEQTFLQYRQYRLLETQDWQPWQRMIEHEFSKPQVREHWERVKHQYDSQFGHVVDSVVERLLILERLIQQPVNEPA